jgi:Zierdtviridae exonuclease
MTEVEVDFEPIYKAPEIPSKWEIIPIHNSDRGSFKRCRRYWDWNSPARHNYTVRADVYGVNIPMWFGTGIHYALEQFYNPGLRRDPVEAFRTWFDIQWRGGTVTPDWLDLVYDLNPEPADAGLFKVKGLSSILPDPDHLEFEELLTLGVKMMEFYKEYAANHDGFEVVMAEHNFSIPIWDYEYDRILKAHDHREDSPNFGKLLEVHARGRTDAITIRPNGKWGIVDHKTTQSIDDLRKLEMDEQCTSYLYALEVEAVYYDLPHRGQAIEEVLYNVLRKAYPKPPTMLKNGMFSVDRLHESTTYELLMKWIDDNNLGIVKLNEKQQGYVDWLREVGDEQFIVRRPVRRNRHQIANAGQRLYLEALDMLYDPRIYPNITNDWSCLNCQFRMPCLAKEDGGDWQQLLRDNYTINRDR